MEPMPPQPEGEQRCDRCGAEITTGWMAAICPRREQQCEFWPDDEHSQRFLDSMGWRLKAAER